MVLDGTGLVHVDTGWYLVSISWYCLALGGTGSAKGLNACIFWKKWRFGRVTPMPDRQTTEYRTTQLFYSIKFKLIANSSLFGQVQTSLQCNSISGVGSFHLYASEPVGQSREHSDIGTFRYHCSFKNQDAASLSISIFKKIGSIVPS